MKKDNRKSKSNQSDAEYRAVDIAYYLKQDRRVLHHLREKAVAVVPNLSVNKVAKVISEIDIAVMRNTLDLDRLEKHPVELAEKLADAPDKSNERLARCVADVSELYAERYANRMKRLSEKAVHFFHVRNDEETALALIDRMLV